MSKTTTRGVRITASPRYLEAESHPEAGRFLFAYDITIHNVGCRRVQLESRHWIITNGEGDSEEVRGPGVIGQQPQLAPGESFSYTSFCPLDTPVGTMEGWFGMIEEGGGRFEARIAAFRLSRPGAVN